jgi:hypothetical protein
VGDRRRAAVSRQQARVRVDQITEARQLAHALRQELTERDDDAEIGAERARRLCERGRADLLGAQNRNAAALGEGGDRRRRNLLPAPTRPIGLRDGRDDTMRSADEARERRYGELRGSEEQQPQRVQSFVPIAIGGRSPAVVQRPPSSWSIFLRLPT